MEVTFKNEIVMPKYSTWSTTDLQKLRDLIANGGAQDKIGHVPQIMAALITASGNKVQVKRHEVDQYLFLNGAVKHYSYDKTVMASYEVKCSTQLELEEKRKETTTSMAVGHIPVAIAEIMIAKDQVEVVKTNALFLQACRLIASFFKRENKKWKLILGNSPFYLNTALIPANLPVSEVETIDFDSQNLEGYQLYSELASIKSVDVQNRIIKIMSNFESKLEGKGSEHYVRRQLTLNGEIIQVQGASCFVPVEANGVIGGVQPYVNAKKLIDSARQKFGGGAYWAANNDYVDGVLLKSPFSTYRDLLRCIASVKWNVFSRKEYNLIAFKTSDSNFASA
jgi:hypothetical protein